MANSGIGPMFERVKRWWAREREQTDADFQRRLDELRRKEPVPVFWLFGKTQSGKTTVVRYLTGATDAEIGSGFQPCTHFSRKDDFPDPEAKLLQFLDRRGRDEPIIVPDAPALLNDLLRSMEQQRRRFEGLVDWVLPIDITRPEEGFNEPEYGGPALRTTLMDLLPPAQRHTLEMVEKHIADLKE